MAEIVVTASNSLFIGHQAVVYNGKGLPVYGSVVDGNDYFAFHLLADDWDEADYNRKMKALTQATRLVDALNYAGSKTDVAQYNVFPRDGDATIPLKIIHATYEIALKLLEGYDTDREIENLGKTGQGYAGVRTTYNRDSVPEHIMAGIPSAIAWRYLRPYLLDPERIIIRRG